MVFNLTLSGGHIVLELDNTNPVTNPVIENYDRPSFQYDGKTITLCNYGRAIRSLTFDNFGTFTGFDSITTQPTTIQQIADAFSVDIPASGNFNSGGASPQSESIVKIKRRNVSTDFIKAHGSVNIYDRWFLGTRQSQRVAMYYNLTDFSKKTLLDVTEIVLPSQGVESATALSGQNKIAFPISNSRKLVVINDIDDITDYTVYTYNSVPSGSGFGASCPIINDGTHVLIAGEKSNTYTNPYLFKIDAATLALVATASFPFGNGNGAHAGTLIDGYNVFANNGTDCYLAKVDMANLSYTQLQLNMDAITDDIAGITFGILGFTGCAVLSEGSEPNGENLGIVNLDDMTIPFKVKCLPGIGMFYDDVNERLYIGSHLGYMQTVDLADLANNTAAEKIAKTFVARSPVTGKKIKPNEITMDENRTKLYVTDWDNEDGKGSLLEVELIEVAVPTLTIDELLYKFN